MTIYQVGEVVTITLSVKTSNSVLIDADSITSLIIEAPDYTVLNTFTSGWTKTATGTYTYDFALPNSYSYVVAKWTYVSNALTDVEKAKIDIAYV